MATVINLAIQQTVICGLRRSVTGSKALLAAAWGSVQPQGFGSVPPAGVMLVQLIMLAGLHVCMKACKHEFADGLLPLGGGNLDRLDLRTRQADL